MREASTIKPGGSLSSPSTSNENLIVKWVRDWLRPRAQDRDEAFRERNLRIVLPIIVIGGLLNFLLTVLVFQDPWAFISLPSVHVYGIGLCFLALIALIRGNLDLSGILMLAGLFAGIGGLLYLSQSDNVIRLLMSAILIVPALAAAVIVQRRMIMPVIGVTVLTFALVEIAGSASTGTPVDLNRIVIPMGVILVIEGLLLATLRTEFDRRLETLREALQATEAARQRAEEADKAKSQFLANMSHELRTPLNAIIGYDEAMLGGMVGTFTGEQTRLLGNIQVNSRRLLSLINDVLDLSKIESGSLEIFLAPMSPRKVISETVESLRSLAIEKNIDLIVEFDDSVPEVVLSDSRKFQQVLTNLLSNAIKFTHQGGVIIGVDALGDRDHWHVSVRDTGIGIPVDKLDAIFEPFRQIDSTDTRRYRGTGLGLAIAKRLVDAMKGSISVTSTLGQGSKFSVVLPRAAVSPQSSVSIKEPVVAGKES